MEINDCQCRGEVYSHKFEVMLQVPDNIILRYNAPDQPKRTTVCIDRCLVGEIKLLWSLGIETNSCCCGHNKRTLPAHIGVEPDFFKRMEELGYVNSPMLGEGFYFPKSLLG